MSYDTFNKNLEKFLADLTTNFPDIKEFKQLKTGIILTKNFNEKSPEKIFRKNIVENFRNEIIAQNDQFFLNSSVYKCIDDNNFKNIDNAQFIKLFEKLSSIWENLDNFNRQTVWRWLKLLIVLSDKLNK